MDFVLKLSTRAVDRFKIRVSAKRPVHAHAPYTWNMRHIMSADFLADPEKFYGKPDPIATRAGAERKVS